MPFVPDEHLLGEYVEISRPEAIPSPLTYKSGGHTGAMIALFVPTAVGVNFIQSDPGALPPNELHVTLAGLGKADDLSFRQIMEVHDLMKLISENHPPLTGHINGCGRFCNGDDDGDPFFIIPDLPALPNLRQIVIGGLRRRGIEGASDHGYTPHITLTYLPHAEYNPFDIIEKTPVTFGAISLVFGDDRYDYPFVAEENPISKAALIEKIGARHTGAECETIQKMHDLALELGAECHPLTRRAGGAEDAR
jgi:2'-5' RNA ligase